MIKYLSKSKSNLLTCYLSKKQGFFKDQFRTAQSWNSMANAEREAITGVRGAETPVGGSGGQSPAEAECLFVFACPTEAANLPHY